MGEERPELIVGQQRVLGLLTFFASPVLIVVVSGVFFHPVVTLVVSVVLGASLLRSERHRAVGIGLLAGTAFTVACAVLLLATLGGGD